MSTWKQSVRLKVVLHDLWVEVRVIPYPKNSNWCCCPSESYMCCLQHNRWMKMHSSTSLPNKGAEQWCYRLSWPIITLFRMQCGRGCSNGTVSLTFLWMQNPLKLFWAASQLAIYIHIRAVGSECGWLMFFSAWLRLYRLVDISVFPRQRLIENVSI